MERYNDSRGHWVIIHKTTAALVAAFAREDHAGKIDKIIEDAIEEAIVEELQFMRDADVHLLEEKDVITENIFHEYGMRRHKLKTCNFKGAMQPDAEGYWVPFVDAERAIKNASAPAEDASDIVKE